MTIRRRIDVRDRRPPAPEPSPSSLFRDDGFRKLFSAAAASTAGTQVSFVAVPLVAVIALDATPGQVGLLGVLKTVAFLLVGLPAGVWLDRMRRRGVMIGTDLARAVLLGSIPLAWWLDLLTLTQLYVVVLLTGVLTVFFDVAALSYLPSLVGRDRLVDANSKLVSLEAAAGVAGPSLAGFLVQVTAAPVALAIDAATFLWSALVLRRIRRPEPPPVPAAGRPLWRGVGAGIRFVLGHPLLRPIAVTGAATNLFLQIATVTLPLLVHRELGFSAGMLGLFFSCGGVGVLLGALTARRFGERLGVGPTLLVSGLLSTPAGFLVALVDRGGWLWVAMLGWLALTYRIGLDNVLLVSIRQRVTPDPMLNRMNATMRFLFTGVLAIGAAVAGVLGEVAGVRVGMWVAALGLAFAWLPLVVSPVRALRAADRIRPAGPRPGTGQRRAGRSRLSGN
ncbi:MFS transporter [Plantactinospora sp. B24E8]|uniref:MFS transporter n=1 Tax=Plantactinospora sp. B24E8 TaxID=3153567 RepID=UPI00325CBEAB